MDLAHRASLADLPDELLLDILDYFGKQKDKPTPFIILFVLSRINRRLHHFASPLLSRSVIAPSYSSVRKLIKHYRTQSGDKARWVRSIQVGSLNEKYLQRIKRISDPYKRSAVQGFPFVDLRSFTCWQAVANSTNLAFLKKAPHLNELQIAWSSFATFPSAEYWPELETLRLRIYSVHSTIGAPPPSLPGTFRSLATLAIHDSAPKSWWASQVEQLRFPNLRVFTLGNAACSKDSVYRFVHRHPTLLEVNVRFRGPAYLRFDALIKLIEGTGTWKPHTSKTYIFGSGWTSPVSSQDVEYDEIDFHSSLIVPEDTSETLLCLTAFAFSRTPLKAEYTRWDSSLGSPEPRYMTTGLALNLRDSEDIEPEVEEHLVIQDFFTMASRFPFIEELRLAHQGVHWDDSVESIMEAIGPRLADWTNLRKLAISWNETETDSWRGFNLHHPYIDCAGPHMTKPKNPTRKLTRDPGLQLKMLTHWPSRRIYGSEDAERLETALRQQLGEDFDLDAHKDDPSLLVRAWEVRHENLVARLVRCMGEQCPTLEEVEWFPMSPCNSVRTSRWLWKIHRDTARKGCIANEDSGGARAGLVMSHLAKLDLLGKNAVAGK
ncbi:hypothetical protein CERSUDRAFT_70358 [Gelatoporia subvermispora B]|uniref:F-box domain-containing protein n=1 Tax=Ceriporiopsis subvermispora (strain B) TaxID=914234 RepID=M2PYD5_CERS8|nr:hypothetical protein CERSUDRAFT_70358 [Gelatoporia subvermispora B]